MIAHDQGREPRTQFIHSTYTYNGKKREGEERERKGREEAQSAPAANNVIIIIPSEVRRKKMLIELSNLRDHLNGKAPRLA